MDTDILITFGATTRKYLKGETIFYEGSESRYYFQILEGNVKMYSVNEDGKEIIQGKFGNGESFGEPPLFTNMPYPSNAIACQDSIIYKLSADKFLKILKIYPDVSINLLTNFANRIYQKASKVQTLNKHTPELRIISYLDNLKSLNGDSSTKVLVNCTRQEIADSTGLRVETVIRAIMKLKKEKKLDVVNHKVYY